MRVQDNRVIYGSQISDHIYKDNNGQLIIYDAILARTGSYKYRESEILGKDEAGQDIGDFNKIVDVYRTEEEVFNPRSMASFENKPFVDNHPEEDVGPDNIRDLSMGYMRNIRRGTGEYSNCLIGDIVVTDPYTIKLIESGKKRELSLGYDAVIDKDNDGKYVMKNIRGNHLALVDDGRAGCATIRDKNTIKNNLGGQNGMSNKLTSKKAKWINRLYDEDIIEVENDDENVILEEMSDDEAEVLSVEELPEEQPTSNHDEQGIPLQSVIERLDKIIELLSQAPAVTDEAVEEPAVEETAPVEEPVADAETPEEKKMEEDIQEPTLYDESEEEVVEGETTMDSNTNPYAPFSNGLKAKDANICSTEDVNEAFRKRYENLGGNN